MGIFDFGDKVFDEIKKLTDAIEPTAKNSNLVIDSYKQLANQVERSLIDTLKPYKEVGKLIEFYCSILLPLLVIIFILIIFCKIKQLFSRNNNNPNNHGKYTNKHD